MRIAEQLEKPRLLLLSQDTDDNSALRIIHALAAYWKFGYSVRYFGESDQAINMGKHTHILIHYRKKDIAYEDWCSDILKIHSDKRVLLLDNIPKQYGNALQGAFGVRGIRKIIGKGKRHLRKGSDKDRLLAGIDRTVSLKCANNEMLGTVDCITAQKLLVDQDGACLLSRMHANYCLSISVWQLGVPGFPQFFSIMRNFLFFADDRGHFSPYPFASLRIDDFPLTSEQYLKAGGVSDEERTAEIEALCAWSEKFSAKLEFMVNSKIVDMKGALQEIDSVVPKSINKLKYYFNEGIININAHGRSHLDEASFRAMREVSPLEFPGLSDSETRDHLSDCIAFIRHFFGKKTTGFVPPCWAYREHLTKKVSADFFSFVIDSSMNYRTGNDWPTTGFVDDMGMVHLLETWHMGSRHFDHTEPNLWETFITCGIPVHMMAHGLYGCDPIPPGKVPRMLILALYVMVFPFLAFWRPGEVLRLFRGIASSRKWDRLGLLRKILVRLPRFQKRSVRNLLKVGHRRGVRWSFAEELAGHIREYDSLELKRYQIDGVLHQIEFEMDMDSAGPFLFHLPRPLISASLDGLPLTEVAHRATLELTNMVRGPHTLELRIQ